MGEWRNTTNRTLYQDSTDDIPFYMPPYYDVHIFCCVHERPPKHRRGCCKGKASSLLCDYMCRRGMAMGLSRIRINRAGCLNRCEMGPVLVVYPEGVWYSYSTEQDVDEILRSHVINGKIVQRLLLQPDSGPRH